MAAAAQASTAPAEWAFVDIGAQYMDGTTFCLVGGELPTSAPLPASVEIAVPAVSTAQWVGEVDLDQPSADAVLPYEVTRRGSMDIYSMTLQGSRLAQVEALVPGLINAVDQEYVVAINWVAPAAVPRVRIAAAMPPNARVLNPVGDARTASDTQGTKHYYREVSDVKAGDTVSLAFSYTIATAETDGAAGDEGGIPTALWVILGAGLVVIAGLVIAIVTQRSRPAEDIGEDAEDMGAGSP